MILDAIIGLFASLFGFLAEGVAIVFVPLINLITAGIEAIVGIFVSGFSLGRIERKKRESKSPASAIGGILTFLINVAFIALACFAFQTKAEKAPLSLSELLLSDLIVVGSINKIRVESEPSRFESGHGNRDWGIYVTLAVETVEKGQLTDDEIEFKCFRIKYRRSMIEYFSPSGHRPIPSSGTQIRVYLNRENSSWMAALPNGITAPDANEDATFWSITNFQDAPEIVELRSRKFTYLLPLELWGIILILMALAFLAVYLARWYSKRRKLRRANGVNP